MFTDPISDYLTRLRNAQIAGHKIVNVPASNMKKSITEILHDKGYISDYAKDYPNREDIAESFLPWVVVRYKAERISKKHLIIKEILKLL